MPPTTPRWVSESSVWRGPPGSGLGWGRRVGDGPARGRLVSAALTEAPPLGSGRNRPLWGLSVPNASHVPGGRYVPTPVRDWGCRAADAQRRDGQGERILVAATVAVRGAKASACRWPGSPSGRALGSAHYRHYPSREALLAALTIRSFNLVLHNARSAAQSKEPAPAALEQFLERTIARARSSHPAPPRRPAHR